MAMISGSGNLQLPSQAEELTRTDAVGSEMPQIVGLALWSTLLCKGGSSNRVAHPGACQDGV